MKDNYSSTGIAVRIWLITSLFFGLGWAIAQLINSEMNYMWTALPAALFGAVGSFPVLIVLAIVIPFINRICSTVISKYSLLLFTCLLAVLPYAALGVAIFSYELKHWQITSAAGQFITCTAILFSASFLAICAIHQRLNFYFSYTTKSNYIMEHEHLPASAAIAPIPHSNHGNKIVIKGVITGALTLIMLIPALFIMNLVTEREQRQKEVTTEISKKWAAPQTLSGPYIYLPYKYNFSNADGKLVTGVSKNLFLLPENLLVKGNIIPEIRQRSIYSVLLYKTDIKNTGNFLIQLPKDVTPDMVSFSEAKVCFNIRDFKGIQDKISINLNGTSYELAPGLPVKQLETVETGNANSAQQEYDRAVTVSNKEIEAIGLSAPINITAEDLGKSISFDMPVKINGSEQLHFVPLAGNSKFELSSSLADPNFDGNNLPSGRTITDKGFTATWNFNKANLPFGTTLKDFDFKKEAYAFGVTLVQPANQYAKTMRSVKYAILFIGLTFALFFIIELMQKNPVHPVQYVLIGIALVIFFTLLLSISEFILFDYAYLIAATATILLITLHAKGHFKSVKTSLVFATVLSCLYSFIFVLIRLEDTALLVGSIGLFIVLAVVMYASRKINWYGSNQIAEVSLG